MLLTEKTITEQGLEQFENTSLWHSKPDILGLTKVSLKCPSCHRFADVKKANLNNIEKTYSALCEYCECKTTVNLKSTMIKFGEKETVDTTKKGWF